MEDEYYKWNQIRKVAAWNWREVNQSELLKKRDGEKEVVGWLVQTWERLTNEVKVIDCTAEETERRTWSTWRD